MLANVAVLAGLERREAEAVLHEQLYASDVRHIERLWLEQGIQGVPAIVFNRRHLLSGAQGVEAYLDILRQLKTNEAA